MNALKICTIKIRVSFLKNCFRGRRASTTAEPNLGPLVDILPET